MKVRGALAGNGGKMAVLQQKLSSDNASTITRRTTKNRRRKRAVEKTPGKDGAERMRQAADKRVGRISEKMADLLEKKALAGDLACARVLFGLAERKKPIQEPVKKRRGPSLAARLAAEPEWQEEDEGGTRD
jgi:hypothetical protein